MSARSRLIERPPVRLASGLAGDRRRQHRADLSERVALCFLRHHEGDALGPLNGPFDSFPAGLARLAASLG